MCPLFFFVTPYRRFGGLFGALGSAVAWHCALFGVVRAALEARPIVATPAGRPFTPRALLKNAVGTIYAGPGDALGSFRDHDTRLELAKTAPSVRCDRDASEGASLITSFCDGGRRPIWDIARGRHQSRRASALRAPNCMGYRCWRLFSRPWSAFPSGTSNLLAFSQVSRATMARRATRAWPQKYVTKCAFRVVEYVFRWLRYEKPGGD